MHTRDVTTIKLMERPGVAGCVKPGKAFKPCHLKSLVHLPLLGFFIHRHPDIPEILPTHFCPSRALPRFSSPQSVMGAD